jgi:hypothetical protein
MDVEAKKGNIEAFHRANFGGDGFTWYGYIGGLADTKLPVDFVLIGDSHVQMLLTGFFNEIQMPYHKNVYISAFESCLALPNITRVIPTADIKMFNDDCPTQLNNGLTILNKNPNAVLILSQSWIGQIPRAAEYPSLKPLNINLNSNDTNNYAVLLTALGNLAKEMGDHKLVIFGDVPGTGTINDVEDCLNRPYISKQCLASYTSPYNQNQAAINVDHVLNYFASQHKNVYFLNPYDVLCSKEKGTCSSVGPTGIYYSDTAHLSKAGSLYLISYFKKEILNIEKQSSNE